MKDINLGICSIYTENCTGLVSIGFGCCYIFHLFIPKEERSWGFKEGFYLGRLWYFGCGPLFLLTYCEQTYKTEDT